MAPDDIDKKLSDFGYLGHWVLEHFEITHSQLDIALDFYDYNPGVDAPPGMINRVQIRCARVLRMELENGLNEYQKAEPEMVGWGFNEVGKVSAIEREDDQGAPIIVLEILWDPGSNGRRIAVTCMDMSVEATLFPVSRVPQGPE